jgi:hypothetical protein
MVSKNFMISDEDLAILERAVPVLHDLCSQLPGGYMRPDVQVAIEEAKRILSDVRWGYGPFSHVEIIEPESP